MRWGAWNGAPVCDARGPALAALLIWLSFAGTARAQAPTSAFAELPTRLAVGQTIFVTDERGETSKGTLLALSDRELTLRRTVGTRTDDVQLPAAAVQRVARQVSRARRGALIGSVVGFGVGAVVVVAALESSDSFFTADARAVLTGGAFFGAIGAGVGAVTGARVQREKVVFIRDPQARDAHVAVMPWLGRSDAGLRVRLTF